MTAASTVAELGPTDVHLWWARRDGPLRRRRELLDQAEVARLARLRREADRDRLVVGAALIRMASGSYLNLDPAEVPMTRACPTCGQEHGKPRVASGGLELSLSHSADLVVLAVARSAPLGVDIEQLSDRLDVDSCSRLLFHPAELAKYWRLPQGERRPAFFRAWTLKEAALKATGDGTRVPFTDLRLAGTMTRPRLASWAGRPGNADRIVLCPLPMGAGYTASLAVIGRAGDWRITWLEGPAVASRS